MYAGGGHVREWGHAMATSGRSAIGYLRVSTETQASEGVSLEAQRARIEAWCELNDYQLLGIEEDAGISGSRANNRPGLQRALERVCSCSGHWSFTASRAWRDPRSTRS